MMRTLTLIIPLLVSTLTAQPVVGEPQLVGPPTAQSYTFDDTSTPARFFGDLAEILAPYQPIVLVGSGGPDIPLALSQQFAAAADTAASFADALHSGLGEPGTPRPLALTIAAGVDALSRGLSAIAHDMSDGSFDQSFGPTICAAALSDLSNSIPAVHPMFAGSQQALIDAANSMLALANIEDPALFEPQIAELYNELMDFHRLMKIISMTLMPPFDAPIPVSGTISTGGAACPVNYPFRGCTTYIKTVYQPPPFCSDWAHIVGGLGAVGTTILPDSGLYVRVCWWVTATTVKEVCECYASRWDRFWAQDGVNKTIEESGPAFGTDSTNDYEVTGFTPPGPGAPATPDPDIEVG